MAEDSEEDRPDLRMVKDVVTGYTVRWHEHVSPTNHLVNAASFKDPALLRKALAAGADPRAVKPPTSASRVSARAEIKVRSALLHAIDATSMAWRGGSHRSIRLTG